MMHMCDTEWVLVRLCVPFPKQADDVAALADPPANVVCGKDAYDVAGRVAQLP